MGRLLHDHASDYGFILAAVVAPERPSWLEERHHATALDSVPAADVDLLVDFTLPAGLAAAAEWSRRAAKPLVSGTTGLGPEHDGQDQHEEHQYPQQESHRPFGLRLFDSQPLRNKCDNVHTEPFR